MRHISRYSHDLGCNAMQTCLLAALVSACKWLFRQLGRGTCAVKMLCLRLLAVGDWASVDCGHAELPPPALVLVSSREVGICALWTC